ncbi:MAG TPA: hypothetical protein VFW65_12010 [Pseudonocardiaceae bacterium]|nr:hypothetical protein [Pseudonocardiaceae bacterium]
MAEREAVPDRLPHDGRRPDRLMVRDPVVQLDDPIKLPIQPVSLVD